jgi:hypothetical protein
MINIAEILKEKPKGTKLWTPIFGTVSLSKIYEFHGEIIIDIGSSSCGTWSFTKDGKFESRNQAQAEMTIFPSKKMKDWSKFAWKEGDILVNTTDKFFPKIVVFKKFVDEDYTTFESTCGLTSETKLVKYSIQSTLSYCKMKNEDDVRITKEKIDELIREEEAANSPSHTFQPFDKVLVRDSEQDYWKPNLFGFKSEEEDDDYPYMTVSGCYAQCIPYNEKTKHLLGTTEPYKED